MVGQRRLADAGAAALADGVANDDVAKEISAYWEKFAVALDDDFAVPRALAVIHTTVKAGNNAMAAIVGIDPLDPQWAGSVQGTGDSDVQQALASLVEHELELRAAARKEKDFATADGVRDRLVAAGIEVIDTPNGAEWKLR